MKKLLIGLMFVGLSFISKAQGIYGEPITEKGAIPASELAKNLENKTEIPCALPMNYAPTNIKPNSNFLIINLLCFIFIIVFMSIILLKLQSLPIIRPNENRV